MKDKSYRGVRVPWRYLVANHGEATLRNWALRLKCFRICRAVPGGHAADGDSLRLALKDSDLPRRLLKDFPAFDSAGWRLIENVPVHIDLGEDVLWLSLCGAEGDLYAVTEKDIENALAIEDRIKPLAKFIIDPPVDSPFCIAPAFWPEFWHAA